MWQNSRRLARYCSRPRTKQDESVMTRVYKSTNPRSHTPVAISYRVVALLCPSSEVTSCSFVLCSEYACAIAPVNKQKTAKLIKVRSLVPHITPC